MIILLNFVLLLLWILEFTRVVFSLVLLTLHFLFRPRLLSVSDQLPVASSLFTLISFCLHLSLAQAAQI